VRKNVTNCTYQCLYDPKRNTWSASPPPTGRKNWIWVGSGPDQKWARMEDWPGLRQEKGKLEWQFETCATNLRTGEVFADLKFGFTLVREKEGASVKPTLSGGEPKDVETAPSKQWLDAVKKWNEFATKEGLQKCPLPNPK
jgi:hypothetical protein